MDPRLQNILTRTRRRVCGVIWLHGLCQVLSTVIGLAILTGLLDWLIHMNDPEVRLLFGLAILAIGMWMSWRYLFQPLRHGLSDLEIANRIEARYPGLRDGLGSSVQFEQSSQDPAIGSPALQKLVIEQTTDQMRDLKVGDVVNFRPLGKVAFCAMTVVLFASLLVGLNQASARIAVNRLIFPFSDMAWPRTTELQLLDADMQPVPTTLNRQLQRASGEILRLHVENRLGDMPEDVRLFIRDAQGKVTEEPLEVRQVVDDSGGIREVAVIAHGLNEGSFDFRVSGGDDDHMPWCSLHVVPPPQIAELQVMLHPPAYSGQEIQKLPSNVGHFSALIGTRVRLTARANKWLKAAKLQLNDDSPRELKIGEDGTTFHAEFDVASEDATAYRLLLTDAEGFQNRESIRYEIDPIVDRVPEIRIDEPTRDARITVSASIEMRMTASDDLGLKMVQIGYQIIRPDVAAPPTEYVRLFPEPEPANEKQPNNAALPTEIDTRQEMTLDYLWEISGLDVSVGDQIVFFGEATDEFNLGEPHIGRSLSYVLTIVTPDAKQLDIASGQATLKQDLDEILQKQIAVKERTDGLAAQLRATGRFTSSDLEQLRQIEFDQRWISSQLSNPVDGLIVRTDELLREIGQNNLDDFEAEQRLNRIADELKLINSRQLPVIEDLLLRVRKETSATMAEMSQQRQTRKKSGNAPAKKASANESSKMLPPGQRESNPDSKSQVANLAGASQNQTTVINNLSELKSLLSRWQTKHELKNELTRLIENQAEINQDSAQVFKETIGKTVSQLTPQQRADLARAATRQRGEAERIDRVRRELGQSLPQLSGSERDAVEEIVNTMDASQLGNRMRETGDQLARNDVGRAGKNQADLLEELRKLRDDLNRRKTSDIETLIRKLENAQIEFGQLKNRQQDLAEQLRKATQKPESSKREQELDRLRKHQKKLKEDTERAALELRRLRIQKGREAARRATENMQQARRQLGEGNLVGAQGSIDETLEELEQIEREIARAKNRAEEQLAFEALERMVDELAGLAKRQQSAMDETKRLEQERLDRGRWSRAHLKSLLNLRDVQLGLKQETDRLAEDLKAAEAFQLALLGAARHMQRAVDRIGKRQADESTVEAQTAACERILSLVEIVKQDFQMGTQNGSGNGNGGNKGVQQPPREVISQLAQLRVIRALQQDLLEETRALDMARNGNGELTADQLAELNRLIDQQRHLTDLARTLTAQIAEAFEVEEKSNESTEDVPIPEEGNALLPDAPSDNPEIAPKTIPSGSLEIPDTDGVLIPEE